MPSAAASVVPRKSRLASAVIISLLALVISCLPYLVQPGVETNTTQRGFVDTLDQIALSAHSESLRLQKGADSDETDPDQEADSSHSWLTTPRSYPLLGAASGTTFSSIESHCLPYGCDYRIPPLRAPPLV